MFTKIIDWLVEPVGIPMWLVLSILAETGFHIYHHFAGT